MWWPKRSSCSWRCTILFARSRLPQAVFRTTRGGGGSRYVRNYQDGARAAPIITRRRSTNDGVVPRRALAL